MELIDKTALVVEVERLRNKAIKWRKGKGYSEYEIGKRDAYNIVLNFIKTLNLK